MLDGQLEDLYLDMVHSILTQLKRDGHFQDSASLLNLFLQETVLIILEKHLALKDDKWAQFQVQKMADRLKGTFPDSLSPLLYRL